LETHVTLLGLLIALWGGLGMLIGVSMALIAGGALVMMEPGAANIGFAAGLTAGMFAILGVFGLVWGGAHLWTGSLIRRRRPFGRIMALALAVINLIVLPFGTALGIYALWVLLKNDSRRLFLEAPG
jgi:hypothetical protein